MHSESILVRIPSKRDDSQKPKRPPKLAGGRKKAENLDLALINHLDEAPHSTVFQKRSRHAEDLPGRGKGDKACNVAHILGWIAAYARKPGADLPEA